MKMVQASLCALQALCLQLHALRQPFRRIRLGRSLTKRLHRTSSRSLLRQQSSQETHRGLWHASMLHSLKHLPFYPSHHPITRCYYSTHSNISSPQGTVGKGESGIAEETNRTLDILEAPEHLDEKERHIFDLLRKALPCKELQVQDISGGCGSQYGISIVSERFKGLSMLKQHRLVNELLKEEIKAWHALRLKTSAP